MLPAPICPNKFGVGVNADEPVDEIPPWSLPLGALSLRLKSAFRGCVFILERRGSEGIADMQDCLLCDSELLRRRIRLENLWIGHSSTFGILYLWNGKDVNFMCSRVKSTHYLLSRRHLSSCGRPRHAFWGSRHRPSPVLCNVIGCVSLRHVAGREEVRPHQAWSVGGRQLFRALPKCLV